MLKQRIAQFGFFLPQIVQTVGMSDFGTSLVSALPYVVAFGIFASMQVFWTLPTRLV